MDEPTVAAEARRRFALLQDDPRALDGPLKTTWLAIAARNASASEWDRLRQLATTAPGQVERQAFYRLLGAAKDPALAQKALDFALTGEAGTSSAAIIAAVSAENADLAFDFAVAHRAAVEALVDSGGQPDYIAGLAAASRDPAMIGKLERFGATLTSDLRRPVDARIAALRQRLDSEPRLTREIGQWLARR